MQQKNSSKSVRDSVSKKGASCNFLYPILNISLFHSVHAYQYSENKSAFYSGPRGWQAGGYFSMNTFLFNDLILANFACISGQQFYPLSE
jgi:hypothetical protein